MFDDLKAALATAKDLASLDGENVEYDRALVELIASMLPEADAAKQYVAGVILSEKSRLRF